MSHWYVAINRRQFNLQVCHLAKQNHVRNNYWVCSHCFVCPIITDSLPVIVTSLSLLISHTHTLTHTKNIGPTSSSFIISWAKQGSAGRTASRCHVRGISPWIPQRENYSDAFRCPARPYPMRSERFWGLRGRQSGCDRLRLNARDGAFLTHTTASWTAA